MSNFRGLCEVIHPNRVVVIRDDYVGNASRVEDQHINFRVITDAIFGEEACFFWLMYLSRKGSQVVKLILTLALEVEVRWHCPGQQN